MLIAAGNECHEDDGHDNHSFDLTASCSRAHKDGDILSSFLTEFTGGAWPLADKREDEARTRSSVLNARDRDISEKPVLKTAEHHAHSSIAETARADAPTFSEPSTEQEQHIKSVHPLKQTQARAKASPVAGKAETADAASQPHDSTFLAEAKIASYSTVCKLSNTTYLRRINLRKDDAVRLFPDIYETLESAFAKRQNDAPCDFFKKSAKVFIQDSVGRRWPVVLECSRTSGQRHIRLSSGWEDLCRANELCVGKRLRLQRRGQPQEISCENKEMLVKGDAPRCNEQTLVTLSIL